MNMIRQQVSTLKGGVYASGGPAPVSAYILSMWWAMICAPSQAAQRLPHWAQKHPHANACNKLALGTPCPHPFNPPTRARCERRPSNASNTLVGSNRQSVEAAAAHLRSDFNVITINEPLVGDVGTAAETIIAALDNQSPVSAPTAIVWGRNHRATAGDGRGGRNQEMALLVAQHLNARNPSQTVHFLSGGTDGRDGPTDAAGAIVDAGTWPRIQMRVWTLRRCWQTMTAMPHCKPRVIY